MKRSRMSTYDVNHVTDRDQYAGKKNQDERVEMFVKRPNSLQSVKERKQQYFLLVAYYLLKVFLTTILSKDYE